VGVLPLEEIIFGAWFSNIVQ